MAADSEHALFSPSSGHKWMRCAGALAMEDGLPNTTNDSAEQGTAAHELASWALTDTAHFCAAYVGRVTSNDWEVTEAMAEATQVYVDAIRARVDEYYTAGAANVFLYIENKVDLSDVLGIPDQFGTSDSIFLVEWTDGTWLIGVEDFKFGYRMVNAQENEQLMLYALAALDQYGIVGNFTRARMVIHQPNREHISEWECSVEELLEFGKRAKTAATAAQELISIKRTGLGDVTDYLTPGEKQCQWCKAAGTCPALGKFVQQTVGDEFEDLTAESVASPQLEKFSDDNSVMHSMVNRTLQIMTDKGLITEDDIKSRLLATYLKAMPLVEIWCKGVLTAAEAFMFDGGLIDGWKVVAGKKGRRSWGSNAKDAEEVMKAMRLRQEEMYSFKLISPTEAEKVLKDSPKRWNKLQKLVVQSDGQPAVVEESDKRPPMVITKPADDFEVVIDDGATLA